MDPDVALAKIREALSEIENDLGPDAEEMLAHSQIGQVIENFDALDGWLKRGGFLPKEWAANR